MNPTPLRPGSQTGSFENYMMSGSPGDAPSIGMGATILQWTDRHAATIVAVECRPGGEPHVVSVQLDHATRTDQNGMSDSQHYAYAPNLNGAIYHYKRTRDGAWRRCRKSAANRWVWDGEERLLVGVRRHYHDFSF